MNQLGLLRRFCWRLRHSDLSIEVWQDPVCGDQAGKTDFQSKLTA